MGENQGHMRLMVFQELLAAPWLSSLGSNLHRRTPTLQKAYVGGSHTLVGGRGKGLITPKFKAPLLAPIV